MAVPLPAGTGAELRGAREGWRDPPFYILSECDRQLLAAAATKVVAQQRAAILEFLDGPARSGPSR